MAIPEATLDALLTRMQEELPEFFGTNTDGTRIYSDAYLRRFLGVAGNIHGRYPICTVYAAAHLITLDQETGGEGTVGTTDGGVRAVKEIETGDMLVEYQDAQELSVAGGLQREAFWEQSQYGRTFLVLERRLLVPTILVI